MADRDPGTLRAIDTDIANDNDAAEIAAVRTKRKKMFAALAAGIALIGGGYTAYDIMAGSKHAVTDNAYVGADVAQVTSQISAPVAAVSVQDAQQVRRGDILVRLDDTDAKIAVALAEADLQRAMRRVQGFFAADNGLEAQINARAADEMRAEAEIAAAKASYDKARIDFERRRSLVESGAVSADELTAVRNAYDNATAGLRAAQAARAQAAAGRNVAIGDRDANRAMIANASLTDNPEVLAARAALDQARVNLERTLIRAPVDGIIARRQVQVGQRVQPGAMLMTVVPIQAAYVDANFKEVELAKVRPGQPVKLTSDLYGTDVVYHGRVVGFSGGTGAAFALVPAQNATGNWIKVVQRLPVRIKLDPKELAAHPLRVGLSMTVDVKIAD